MPYPFQLLPYGFRRRLRELARPHEVYALQIAAPEYVHFEPIQMCEPLDFVMVFGRTDNQTSLHDRWYHYTRLPTDRCTILTGELHVERIQPRHNSLLLPDHLRYAPQTVSFFECQLTPTHFQAVFNRLERPVTQLKITDCTFDREKAVQIVANAAALKSLRVIIIHNRGLSLKCWIEAFLEAKFTNFEEIYVHKSTMTEFDVEVETLFKFFKAQTKGCKLITRMNEYNAESLLNERFSKYFECGPNNDQFWRLSLKLKDC